MDDIFPLYLLAFGFAMLLAVIIWLVSQACRSLATMAEVMQISHADEIAAFHKAQKSKPPAMSDAERLYRWPESG